MRDHKLSRPATMACLLAITATMPVAAQEMPRTMLVLDGSGSMWGQIDGQAKIEIARTAIGGMLDDWQNDREIGLMAYGHREQGDCADIETQQAPASLDREAFDGFLGSITPLGRTPLTQATREAAEALSYTDAPATVILVSDGRETCNADPCDVAATLGAPGRTSPPMSSASMSMTRHRLNSHASRRRRAGFISPLPTRLSSPAPSRKSRKWCPSRKRP